MLDLHRLVMHTEGATLMKEGDLGMLEPLCIFADMEPFVRRFVDIEVADSVEILTWNQAEDQASASLTTILKDHLFHRVWESTIRPIRTELKWRLVISKAKTL